MSQHNAILCLEDQTLYKLISGVHANVNIHITRNDFDMNGDPIQPNHERYLERVGSHQERIENMFFTYSLVLKAVNNLSGKVHGYSYLSDNPKVDQELKDTFSRLIEESIKSCENPFEEGKLLKTLTKDEFISHVKPLFYNITRILD